MNQNWRMRRTSSKNVILATVSAGLLTALLLTTTNLGDGAQSLAVNSYSSYKTWKNSRRVATALDGARRVELVEYIGEFEIARRVATPDEVLRLRKAISTWPHRFDARALAYLCFDPHHGVEITRSDGSRFECQICFLCKKFSLDEGPTFALLPPYLEGPLGSFFDSVGMSPKTDEEYGDILRRAHTYATVDGAPVVAPNGMQGIAKQDIINALQALHTLRPDASHKFSEITVLDDGQVRFSFDSSLGAYQEMKRVNGRWELGKELVFTR